MALDPAEYSVKDLREEVKGVDAPGELRDALDAERDGKDRKTAKRAIERRLEKVGTDGTGAGEGERTARAGDREQAPDGSPARQSGGTLREIAMQDATRARDRLDARLARNR